MKPVFLLLALLALTRALENVNIEDSMNEFAIDLYKSVSTEQPGNFISSPLSAYVALAMVTYGARGNTKAEFVKVLRMPRQTREGVNKTIDGLRNIGGKLHSPTGEVDLVVANKVYASKNLRLKSRYQRFLRNTFNSSIGRVNFAQSDQAASTINAWSNYVTHGKIEEIVSKDSLDPNTQLVLLNAVYFNGQWKFPFAKGSTTRSRFHVSANVFKDVDMMTQKRIFKVGYLAQMDSQFVQLDYKDDATSLYVILPNEREGLAGLERKIESLTLQDLQNTHEDDLQLVLPKFTISSTLKLERALMEMGLETAFSRSANFTGMMERGNVPIGEVVQKTYISVDEVGTEAAAVTSVNMVAYSLTPILVFNRPFMVVLATRDVILFTGRVVDPTP